MWKIKPFMDLSNSHPRLFYYTAAHYSNPSIWDMSAVFIPSIHYVIKPEINLVLTENKYRRAEISSFFQ